jgi:dephospho-CoA kinase
MAARTLVVGLTGGIGTGKSRVVELLARLGARVVDSDRIVRELQQPGSPALARIAETFGADYLLPDGSLDRARLGKLVFDHPAERAKLNAIMLPAVTARLRERLDELRAAGERVVVLDIPLLLEGRRAGTGAGAVLPFDVVVVVYADEETQIRRVMARDRLSREDATARVRAQLSIEEKRRMADVVVDNGGDWDATEKRVRELFAEWTRAA